MTKRDSSAASLASPRFLRMDSLLAPSANSRQRPSLGASSSSANPGYGNTAPMESVPMLVSGDSWDSSHPQNQVKNDLQPRQGVVHNQLFKLIEVGEGPSRRSQLWISEADSHGLERLRRPGFFLHGIVDQVGLVHQWMAWGREASKIANYCRRYFQIEEVPCTFYQTEPHEHQEDNVIPDNPAGGKPADDDADDTSTMGIPPKNADQVASVPLQISQLTHILYDALIRDPEFNAPILKLLQTPPQDPMESSIRLFTSADLAQLSSHLAIAANVLAWSVDAEDFPDDDDEDLNIPWSHMSISVYSKNLYVCLWHFDQLIRAQLTGIFICLSHASSKKARQRGVCVCVCEPSVKM